MSEQPMSVTVERALAFVAEFHGDECCGLNCLHSEALAAEVYRLREEEDGWIRIAAEKAKDARLRERQAWEAGFQLCRSYGDNHAHFDGEQKEARWRRYLASRDDDDCREAQDNTPLLR